MPSRADPNRGVGLLIACLIWTSALACVTTPAPVRPPAETARAASGQPLALRAAAIARSLVGTPYRFGGASPEGFDCSGLVVYSYARAGRPGLPHSVAALHELTRPVSIEAIRPGDLLYFRLGRRKKSHVGIYVGEGHFVHAPSSGKAVEIVSFDHVYWGPRIRLAGRL